MFELSHQSEYSPRIVSEFNARSFLGRLEGKRVKIMQDDAKTAAVLRAVELLQKKAEELSRIPKKTDFTQEEVILVKAHLGPWPRALEAAGLKEVSEARMARLARRKEKRIRAKVKRRVAKNG